MNRLHDYREHLKTITNGLCEMAKAAGRENYTHNQLLRECYNLINAELDTFEGWKQRGYAVRKGQHAYLFWGEPMIHVEGYYYRPVLFMYAKEQMEKTGG